MVCDLTDASEIVQAGREVTERVGGIDIRGVLGFTVSLAAKVAPAVRVNAICPGLAARPPTDRKARRPPTDTVGG